MQGTTRWTVVVGMVVSALASGQAAGLEPRPSGPAQALGGVELRAERPDDAPDALRLELIGGAPHETLVLLLEGGCGQVRHPILLDARGRWERRVPCLELDQALDVRVVRAGSGGGTVVVGATRIGAARKSPPPSLHQGAVVITEVMKDPMAVSDSVGEWFELVNTSLAVVDLEGWTISDAGSNYHKLSNGGQGIFLNPAQRLVLGNNADPAVNGGVAVGYRYSSFSLANGADEIFLRDGAGMLSDLVAYDDGVLWPDTPGAALSLDQFSTHSGKNDDPSHWCDASTPIGPGNPDLGTPGWPNGACP